jgi:hypothetical protein
MERLIGAFGLSGEGGGLDMERGLSVFGRLEGGRDM